MKTVLLLAFLVPALASGASVPDPSQRKPTLAVLSLATGPGVDSGVSSQLTEQLEADLLATGRIRLLERRQIQSILTEQGFQNSGACDSSECQVQVGRLLGVEQIVVGDISRAAPLSTLSARIVSVSSGAILASHVVDLKGPPEALARTGSREIAGVLTGIRKPPSQRELLTDKRTFWLPWVLGGGAVLLGGGAWYTWTHMSGGGSAPARTSYSVTVETR